MRIKIAERIPCRSAHLGLRLSDPAWSATFWVSMVIVRYPTDPTAPQDWSASGTMHRNGGDDPYTQFGVFGHEFEDWVTEETSDDTLARAACRLLVARYSEFFGALSDGPLEAPARSTAWTRLLTSEL